MVHRVPFPVERECAHFKNLGVVPLKIMHSCAFFVLFSCGGQNNQVEIKTEVGGTQTHRPTRFNYCR